MKHVALAEIKDDFSRFLREASKEELVITRHGKPAGVLVGFASEDDWLDHNLENNPEFLNRIATARAALERGEGITLSEYKRGLSDSVEVGPTKITFDDAGQAIFTRKNFEETKSYLAEKLQRQLIGHKIRPYTCEIVVHKKAMELCRVRRAKSYFKEDFEKAVAAAELFLAKNAPKDWEVMALDFLYRDDEGINQNPWRDFSYLSARWIKVEK